MTAPALLSCLDDELLLALGAAPEPVREMIGKLVSDHAIARMLGLDAVHDVVISHGVLQPDAPKALPFLLTLACSPRYPHASGILARLHEVLAACDDPPRSAATEGAHDPLARETYAILAASASRLLHVARRSKDPEACRMAARMASHFPSADAESVPVLLALLSGVRDAEARAPLTAALARVRG